MGQLVRLSCNWHHHSIQGIRHLPPFHDRYVYNVRRAYSCYSESGTNQCLCRSYIAVPTFFVLWLGYKLIYKTTVIPSEDVDLVSGLQQINDEEEKYLMNEKAKGPQTRLQRIWDSL